MFLWNVLNHINGFTQCLYDGEMNFFDGKFSCCHIIGVLTNFVEKWSFSFGTEYSRDIVSSGSYLQVNKLFLKIATKNSQIIAQEISLPGYSFHSVPILGLKLGKL